MLVLVNRILNKLSVGAYKGTQLFLLRQQITDSCLRSQDNRQLYPGAEQCICLAAAEAQFNCGCFCTVSHFCCCQSEGDATLPIPLHSTRLEPLNATWPINYTTAWPNAPRSSQPPVGWGGGRSDRNIQVSNPHTCNKAKRFCSPGQRCVYLMRLILIPTLRVLGSPSVSFLICINYGAGSTEQMNWCYFH